MTKQRLISFKAQTVVSAVEAAGLTREAFALASGMDPRELRYLLSGERRIRRWHWERWRAVVALPPFELVDDDGFGYEDDSWCRSADEQLTEIGDLRKRWGALSALRTLRYLLQHGMCVAHDNALDTSIGIAIEGTALVAHTARVGEAQAKASWWLGRLDECARRVADRRPHDAFVIRDLLIRGFWAAQFAWTDGQWGRARDLVEQVLPDRDSLPGPFSLMLTRLQVAIEGALFIPGGAASPASLVAAALREAAAGLEAGLSSGRLSDAAPTLYRLSDLEGAVWLADTTFANSYALGEGRFGDEVRAVARQVSQGDAGTEFRYRSLHWESKQLLLELLRRRPAGSLAERSESLGQQARTGGYTRLADEAHLISVLARDPSADSPALRRLSPHVFHQFRQAA